MSCSASSLEWWEHHAITTWYLLNKIGISLVYRLIIGGSSESVE
jgi:hypothetical protein